MKFSSKSFRKKAYAGQAKRTEWILRYVHNEFFINFSETDAFTKSELHQGKSENLLFFYPHKINNEKWYILKISLFYSYFSTNVLYTLKFNTC